MIDQAQSLRDSMKSLGSDQGKKEAKTFAVISGKGGVGKSNFSLNFSLALQTKGYKVLLLDLDIGMANIDVLMGMTQKYSIVDLFERGLTIEDITRKGPEGLSYIAGGSGLRDIFYFNEQKRNQFFLQLQQISVNYDFILFDMGAGITTESRKIILSCDEVFVLSTCEPTSMTDAYSAIKFVCSHPEADSIKFQLLINRAIDSFGAKSTARRLNSVAAKFLKKELCYIGYLPDDKHVPKAVMEQTPFFLRFPSCQASKALKKLTSTYLSNNTVQTVIESQNFFTKLRSLFG
ncbi:Flagellum site-determining protein YlxH [Bacillus sp. THAF10]|uniref:MinD/ParA family protein n=1 Tax=Bacillus sp. THAF10 TaxID=2587848 RepID=UPI001267FA1D|nr:MinD/ParA family protein [Bacillus sp. THAF10]QFT88885.1 Flagellum site-determining protein YlxH [Bacillus sp. THAF10]